MLTTWDTLLSSRHCLPCRSSVCSVAKLSAINCPACLFKHLLASPQDALIQKFKDRIAEKKVPTEAQEVIDSELEKLSSLDKNAAEFNVSRNYLEWLTCLPYDAQSVDNFDLARAKEILDKDHYGLQVRNSICINGKYGRSCYEWTSWRALVAVYGGNILYHP